MRSAHELLYDSEASLRAVDRAIGDLSPARAERAVPAPLQQHLEQQGAHLDRARTLMDDYADTAAVVVRFCQSAGMVDCDGIEALQQMPGRLRAVSTRTETATTDILGGLARAAALVDALDATAVVPDGARHQIAASLRDELNVVSHHLQFQDITSQQLADIAALFADMRGRIAQVVSIFTPPAPAAIDASPPISLDDSRALADEIFALQEALKPA